MLKVVWIALTAITLLASNLAQSTFITVFTTSGIENRNVKIKVLAIKTSTGVIRIVRKQETGTQSASEIISKQPESKGGGGRTSTRIYTEPSPSPSRSPPIPTFLFPLHLHLHPRVVRLPQVSQNGHLLF
ncbi:uncharacterized protein DFL_005627 [Arthrobotrys flagrans]|uniref:Uncharacterized protein n=1 Tax=Arthrobotrys flagrans TaxID=97331 RepID=A0A436ZYR1_ARTFL|nr:hypothetical protein DFL_005627 [Arthrobotrys flagrans]